VFSLEEQNHELKKGVAVLAQRLLGEIETGGDINAIKRMAVFGGPVAMVARIGGGFVEAFEATERRMEQIDWALTLRLARAGFGPEERMAMLPLARSRLLGSPRAQALPPAQQPSLPSGVI